MSNKNETLTKEEIEQIQAYLADAKKINKETAAKSKKGFLAWLQDVSLGHIASKLIDMTWKIIRSYFNLPEN